MICASITEKTVESMVRVGNRTNADLVEVRLDFLKDLSNIQKLSKIKKPLIATCMPVWEGGCFKGTEIDRLKIIEESLSFAKYVTIELRTLPSLRNALIKKARKNKVAVIVAYHDFKKTLSRGQILKIISVEKKAGDIAKVAFMSQKSMDVLNLISILAENKGKPLIALSMGSLGRVSRVLGPLFGSYLTYGSVSKGRETGPGQLTVDELKDLICTLKGG